jgi:F-type H+-transporting ATPase subunit epsilon
MADKVKFELVSPEKILVSEDVDMVVVPGTEGNFGVLPGHSPLISSVRPGLIAVYEGNVVVQQIFVAGGFAEVTPVRCTVLADAAIVVSAIDRVAAEADLRDAEARLPALRDAAEKGGESEKAAFRAVERSARIATAKLEATNTALPH